MKSKTAMSLPVNVVVMTILGIIIFSLGLGLFNKIYNASGNEIEDLQNSIRNDIAALQCDGEEWICSPSNELRVGDSEVFQIFIANRDEQNKGYKISFPNLVTLSDGAQAITNSCGSVVISYLDDLVLQIPSGNSASLPMIARATRVDKFPCSFTTTVNLLDESDVFIDQSPVIIRVE